MRVSIVVMVSFITRKIVLVNIKIPVGLLSHMGLGLNQYQSWSIQILHRMFSNAFRDTAHTANLTPVDKLTSWELG